MDGARGVRCRWWRDEGGPLEAPDQRRRSQAGTIHCDNRRSTLVERSAVNTSVIV